VVVARRIARHVLQLGQRLDASVASTDNDDVQVALADLRAVRGLGDVETEPTAIPTCSYSRGYGSPSSGWMVATRSACRRSVTLPVRISAPRSTRRSGTTTCRGETAPAAASGRNGWYVMYERGFTTVTTASSSCSFFSRRSAVYRPT
jgi:hypothetical protein